MYHLFANLNANRMDIRTTDTSDIIISNSGNANVGSGNMILFNGIAIVNFQVITAAVWDNAPAILKLKQLPWKTAYLNAVLRSGEGSGYFAMNEDGTSYLTLPKTGVWIFNGVYKTR